MLDSIDLPFIYSANSDNFKAALSQLVEIMVAEQGFDDKYAQHAMLRAFTLFGGSHPMISKFRPKLSCYTH